MKIRNYNWILDGFSKKLPKLGMIASAIFGGFKGWNKEKNKRK